MIRRLALDTGEARIGLAVSEGELCLPLKTLANDENAIANILSEITTRSIGVLYIGLPLNLSGQISNSARRALALARTIAGNSEVSIRMIDERLTTKSAAAILRTAGKTAKSSKTIIDAQAAAIILEAAIQQERTGLLAGKALEEFDE